MWDEWQGEELTVRLTDYQRGVAEGRRFAEGQLAEHAKMEASLVKRIAALEAELMGPLIASELASPPIDATPEATAQARRESFRAAALPLVTWLAENANPHAVAHVDSELAELLEGALVVPRKL